MSGHFANYARVLQEKGYDPVPIKPGEKKITLKDWQSRQDLIDNPRQGWKGVSHRTVTAPAIDVDVRDSGVTQQLVEWMYHQGFKGFRYGERPKFACLAQWPSTPQRKIISTEYDLGRIEILGAGQQLVIFNEHPNGYEYEWENGSPLDMNVKDLPVLTDDLLNDLFTEFERLMDQAGHTRINAGSALPTDNLDTPPPERTAEEIELYLNSKDPDCGYDEWVKAGMAVHHAGGSVEQWIGWSEQSPKFPGIEPLLEKWRSFSTSGPKAHLNLDPDQALELAASVLDEVLDIPPIDVFTPKPSCQLPPADALRANLSAFQTAKITPRCIVDDYLYANLSLFVAPGGTGKTTVLLHEMICIILGIPLWGHEVLSPGPCLLITAEDEAEMCRGRAWRIMQGLNLSEAQQEIVARDLLIWDVTGERVRLTHTEKDIEVTDLPDLLATHYQDLNLQMITFDPLVSFGAGEQGVNDAGQALVTAARRTFRMLDCCVRYVHHTSQIVAREKITDQYAARGGTALVDGSRMVTVMQPLADDDRIWEELEDCLPKHDTVIVMAMPKMSYAKEKETIYLKREGFTFGRVKRSIKSVEEQDTLDRSKIREALDGITVKVSRRSFELNYRNLTGLGRDRFRALLGRMIDDGDIVELDVPEDEKSRGFVRHIVSMRECADSARA